MVRLALVYGLGKGILLFLGGVGVVGLSLIVVVALAVLLATLLAALDSLVVGLAGLELGSILVVVLFLDVTLVVLLATLLATLDSLVMWLTGINVGDRGSHSRDCEGYQSTGATGNQVSVAGQLEAVDGRSRQEAGDGNLYEGRSVHGECVRECLKIVRLVRQLKKWLIRIKVEGEVKVRWYQTGGTRM